MSAKHTTVLFVFLMLAATCGTASAAWLPGWDHRIQLTTNGSVIDDNLLFFPISIQLGISAGITSADVSFIFDELQSNANSSKIAVTKADGISELYVEIEQWDDYSEKAALHVSKSDWTLSSAGEDLYLYFDSNHIDNVNVTELNPNVWDSYFKLVNHHNIFNLKNYKEPDGVITATAAYDYYICEPSVLYRNNSFQMWAHVISSGNKVYHFSSNDGVNWTDNGDAVSGTAMYRTGVLWVEAANKYYMYGPNAAASSISLYTSTSETGFTLDTSSCITEGAPGDWDDEGLANSFVWIESGNNWKMFYEGWSGSCWRSGLATSNDGKNWTKQGAITMPNWDPAGQITIGWVTKVGTTYYGLLHGSPRALDPNTEIWLIQSTDLLNWTVLGGPTNTFITRNYFWEGQGLGSGGQTADPFVLEHNDSLWIYYEGISSQTHPATHPHRIGLCKLPGTAEDWFANFSASMEDSTVNNNDPADFMFPEGICGKVGAGTHHNSSAYLEISDNTTLDFGDNISFTVEVVVKTPSGTDPLRIWSKRDTDGIGYELYLDTLVSNISWYIGQSGENQNAGNIGCSGTKNIRDGVFHHIVLERDIATSKIKTFVDGIPEVNVTLTVTGDVSTARNLHTMLSRTDGETLQCWQGDLDESRVSSNIARSNPWIEATYNSLWDSLMTYGSKEDNPAGLNLTAAANQYTQFNDWETAHTFSQIAAINPNDVVYSWYNHTSGLHEAYYVSRTYNQNAMIPYNCSVMGFFNTETIITVTERTNITIPNAAWFYGFLPGSSNMTVTNINTSMNTDGLACQAVYRWDGSAWNATGTVQPKEGIITYNTNAGEWTP